MDTIYVNGQQVGSSSWVENPRVYPAVGALKPGRNVIAIRLFKVEARRRVHQPSPTNLRLVLGDGTAIPLAGEWKGKVAVDGHPPQPLPPGYENVTSMPGVLYNGMLAPIAPLAITGAIWYQGESNAERAYQYRKLLPAMIADWRKLFGQGDFPFYIVSLPAYHAPPRCPRRRFVGRVEGSPGAHREERAPFVSRHHRRYGRPGQHSPDGQERGRRTAGALRSGRALRPQSSRTSGRLSPRSSACPAP